MRNGRLTLDMICRRYVAARFKNIDCTYEGLPLSTHSDSDPITSEDEDEVPGQVPSDAAGVMGTSFSPSTLCSWPWWPYKLTTQDAILIVQGAMTTQDAILIVQGAMISSFVSSCSFNFSSSADAWHRAEKMLSKSSHVVFVSAFISLRLVSATSSSFAASLSDDDEDDYEAVSDDDEGFLSSSAAVGPLDEVGFANNASKRCCAASVQSPRAPETDHMLINT